jgi:hypothetical protein
MPDFIVIRIPCNGKKEEYVELKPLHNATIKLIDPISDDLVFDENQNVLYSTGDLNNVRCTFEVENVYGKHQKSIRLKREIIVTPFNPDPDITVVGKLFYHQLVTNSKPKYYTAIDLPPGLKIIAETGEVFGKFMSDGVFYATFSACDEDDEGFYQTMVTFKVRKPTLKERFLFKANSYNSRMKQIYPLLFQEM